ncbi:MFS transporter [Luteibacter pinisoli]|uniref:MFS transporter n=1 Tax=Luteibacter pinisoli TaxID=2589080 RepID=A0A4Y5Z8Y4_9GAMM|nr:MFS transporter [Luteibacter pinisoli]QDE41426.1 MFS transporter [Luteibacter pinisoli]
MIAHDARRPLAIHTFTLATFIAASTAPTPLYRLYQAAWHFTPTLLTVIFAVYAFALLMALLVGGRLSDHLGRRPVIVAAIALDVVALVLFMVADGPAWLIVARLVQGVATGIGMSTLAAALLDLDRQRGATVNSLAPMIGLGAGALGSTAMVVLAPAPLQGVYVVLAVLLLAGLALTLRTPETAVRKPGALASLRPHVAVPERARAALMAVTPLNVALWMLGGFYLSLMPSLVAKTTHSTSPWLGGLTVTALMLSGAIAVLAGLRHAALHALVVGASLLAGGLLLVLVGAGTGSAVGLLVGSVIAGAGFGASFLGAVRSVMPLAEPHERSRLMAAFYIESYVAFSVPTIAVGYVAQHQGLLTAINLYGGVIIALTLAALAWIVLRAQHVRAPVAA